MAVYVAHRGLHAALIVPQDAIPSGKWPAHELKPLTKYLEVGWGDNEGYRFQWTTRIVLRALFWPTPSVLFIRGFDQPVIEEFQGQSKEIIEVSLSRKGFARMCAFIQNYYQLDEHGNPILLGGDFYEAKGSYYLFHDSNHWAASALREAGCPITPCWAITAGNVMFQSRRFGEVIWKR